MHFNTYAIIPTFQAFFSEITYQKSIVESKNKVHQKVNASKPKLKNIDFAVIDQPVEEMNQRFQVFMVTPNSTVIIRYVIQRVVYLILGINFEIEKIACKLDYRDSHQKLSLSFWYLCDLRG